MANLEDKLVSMCQQDGFDLAEAFFIASGIRDERELASYMQKFEGLCSTISEDPKVKSASNKVEKAKAIFDWLWESKPDRYNSCNKLTDALDNQLSKEKKSVGDCGGLTSLYNSICQRFGISVLSVHAAEHIYSVLTMDDGNLLVIENTNKDGFGNGSDRGLIQNNKQFVQAFLDNLSHRYQSENDNERAFIQDKLALKIDPDESWRVDSLKSAGDSKVSWDTVVDAYREILEMHPNSFGVLFYLARSLEHRNKEWDTFEAMKLYKRALDTEEADTKPEASLTHNCLGLKYVKMKKYSLAQMHFQKSIKLEPDNDFSWQLLGEVLAKRGKYHEAIKAYEQSLKLEPDGNCLATFGIGDAKRAQDATANYADLCPKFLRLAVNPRF